MIIRPFDAGFFLLMAVMIGTIVLLWALLRNQPQQRREAVLLTLCVVNIIGFFVYKGFLSADAQFLQVSGLDKFNWFNELPLQLCNINMFLARVCLFCRAARRTHGSGVPGSGVFRLFAVAAAHAGVLSHAHTHPDLWVQPDDTWILPSQAEGFARHHRSASDDCICGVSRGSAAAAHRLSAGKLFLRVRAGYRHQYSEPALKVDTGAVFV